MLRKYVDCASLSFQATLPDRQSYGVLVAKRAYEIGPDGRPVARMEQELLSFADEAYGKPTDTALLYPSDVVPYKPRTDIVLAANSYAPGGVAQPSWACGIEVRGAHPLSSALTVHGPRTWIPKWRLGAPTGFSPRTSGFSGWQLSETEPAQSVPIRWEQAWGGHLAHPDNPQQISVCEQNPVGCGWIDRNLTDHSQPVPAPQLEWPGDPIVEPERAYTPACFGPVMPAWSPRRQLGGTFDAAWAETQQPYWPQDYDFRYHNAAPSALQVNGYLDGNETIVLRNLVEGMPECGLTLPGTGMLALLGDISVRMNLDTLLLDIRSPYPEEWLITTTWRLVVPPVMDYEMALDEVYLSHRRYQNAHSAFSPGDVALSLRLDQETVHG